MLIPATLPSKWALSQLPAAPRSRECKWVGQILCWHPSTWLWWTVLDLQQPEECGCRGSLTCYADFFESLWERAWSWMYCRIGQHQLHSWRDPWDFDFCCQTKPSFCWACKLFPGTVRQHIASCPHKALLISIQLLGLSVWEACEGHSWAASHSPSCAFPWGRHTWPLATSIQSDRLVFGEWWPRISSMSHMPPVHLHRSLSSSSWAVPSLCVTPLWLLRWKVRAWRVRTAWSYGRHGYKTILSPSPCASEGPVWFWLLPT